MLNFVRFMIGTVLSRDIVFAPMIVAVPMLNCLQVESCCDSYWAWQDKVCGDLLHFKFGLALFELLAFLVGLLSPCPNFLYRRGQLKACRNKETICVPKCMGIIRLWPWFLQAPMCSNCVGIHGCFFIQGLGHRAGIITMNPPEEKKSTTTGQFGREKNAV